MYGSVLAAVVTMLLSLSALAQQSFMLMLTVLQVSCPSVGEAGLQALGCRLVTGSCHRYRTCALLQCHHGPRQ